MIYRVRADSLKLRAAPGTDATVAVLKRVPRNSLLQTDLTVDSAGQPMRTGFDDPATPQPARVSSAWVRVVAIQLPGRAWQQLKANAYAAYEWLELERNAAGYPI